MIKITVETFFIEITPGKEPGDLFKIKQLPGRFLDDDRGVWCVPIRPGIAAIFQKVFNTDMAGALLEEGERAFLDLLAAPLSVDPWKVPAEGAVELATLHHFYSVHNGDQDDYARNHPGYVRGE